MACRAHWLDIANYDQPLTGRYFKYPGSGKGKTKRMAKRNLEEER